MRPLARVIVWVLIVVFVLGFWGVCIKEASATSLMHRNWHTWVRHHHVHKHVAKVTKTNQLPPVVLSPSPPAGVKTTPGYMPAMIIADDQSCTADSVMSFLAAHQATVLRYVVTEAHMGDGVDCVNEARSNDVRIYLSVQYDPTDTDSQISDLFADALATYGPVWSVSVGNEERLDDPKGMTVPTSAANYLRVWNRVEPEIAASGARPVVGEADPWATGWLDIIMGAHPVGATAASFHCYLTTQGGLSAVPQVAADAQSDGLPLYCSEMAPATAADVPDFFAPQTAATFDQSVAATFAVSPNVAAESFYNWPSITA